MIARTEVSIDESIRICIYTYIYIHVRVLYTIFLQRDMELCASRYLYMYLYIYVYIPRYTYIHRRRRSDSKQLRLPMYLKIITTANISNKLSQESLYISNTFSRDSPKFQRLFRLSKRSPLHSKDLSRKLIDLEIQIF